MLYPCICCIQQRYSTESAQRAAVTIDLWTVGILADDYFTDAVTVLAAIALQAAYGDPNPRGLLYGHCSDSPRCRLLYKQHMAILILADCFTDTAVTVLADDCFTSSISRS